MHGGQNTRSIGKLFMGHRCPSQLAWNGAMLYLAIPLPFIVKERSLTPDAPIRTCVIVRILQVLQSCSSHDQQSQQTILKGRTIVELLQSILLCGRKLDNSVGSKTGKRREKMMRVMK